MKEAVLVNEQVLFKEDYQYFLTRVKKAKTLLYDIEQHTTITRKDHLRVLAVGGEYGFIEYNLAKWTNWEITTSDIDEKLIMKHPLPDSPIKRMVLDATNLPFPDEMFDLIIFNHVIEHIPTYKLAIGELYRVIKKGGHLYLATPNSYRALTSPSILLANKKNISDERRIALHMGFSADELSSMLTAFTIVKNISKNHLKYNLKEVGIIFDVLPEKLVYRYVQTNVFICQK